MPWQTPTLREVRSLVRDAIRASLPGADANVPNSVLRVMSDNQGALCHLTLEYQDWLALQLMPDTAETEWLDRHGNIWLVNSDGTTGRKMATLASGTVTFTGDEGAIVPLGTQVSYTNVSYELLEQITIKGNAATPGPIRALDPGAVGNQPIGTQLAITNSLDGVDDGVTVVELVGGADTEGDDELRMRVLQRIRQPPMGGAAHDYVRWALAVPGCTRAWCVPLEMGIGTVTVRVLFDVLRADDDGWPRDEDLAAVTAYMDTVRPVAVKDFWVLAPIKQRIDVYINNLVPDNAETRASIEQSLHDMLFAMAAPGQTIYAVWKAQAIMNTVGVKSFDLANWEDNVMLSAGNMAVLGDITYDSPTPTPMPLLTGPA
jgi:uncharacterized phage protein gp47/JayE